MDIIGTYTPSAEESFDSVALRIYGDERYTHLLYLANPKLVHLQHFTGNETLQVPGLEDQAASGMPPWKEAE
jgi:hypothetical protein